MDTFLAVLGANKGYPLSLNIWVERVEFQKGKNPSSGGRSGRSGDWWIRKDSRVLGTFRAKPRHRP